MAIFGDLSDLPFPEIFNMIGRRTGRLLIFGVPGLPPYQLELADGGLKGLAVGPEKIGDPLRVRDKLTALMEAGRGTFEFQRCSREELEGELSLSLPYLLMAIASAVDEISAYRDRFAHPKTRFKILGSEEVWLDEDLYLFLERATPLLLLGCDAETLAATLNVSLEQVQLNLYKLRSVGRVAPARAFEELPRALPPELPEADPFPFLNETTAAPAPAAALEPEPAPVEPAPVELALPQQPGRELLGRLLRSLRSLRWASAL